MSDCPLETLLDCPLETLWAGNVYSYSDNARKEQMRSYEISLRLGRLIKLANQTDSSLGIVFVCFHFFNLPQQWGLHNKHNCLNLEMHQSYPKEGIDLDPYAHRMCCMSVGSQCLDA